MARSSKNGSPASGQTAQVNGIALHHRIRGKGNPLVLLHGGVAASESLEALAEALAKTRQVITVDLQGHGQTRDIDRPLRFETLADDITALLEHLGIAQADLAGYSLGGGAALQCAIRHPERVRKLVLISAAGKRSGWFPEVLHGFDHMGPETGRFMGQSPLAKLYPHIDWAVLFGKLGELLRRDYDWTAQVAALKAQTLLVYADADSLQPAHIVELFGLLGGGKRDAGMDGSARPASQLAILPGFTHYNVTQSPQLAQVLSAFLEAPAPAASR